jgi:hypothetical protein
MVRGCARVITFSLSIKSCLEDQVNCGSGIICLLVYVNDCLHKVYFFGLLLVL